MKNCTNTFCKYQTLQNECLATDEEEIGCPASLPTRQELETERIRLAACGVVARADTEESAKQARTMEIKYHSASCDDVARMVDKYMTLRALVEELMEALNDAFGILLAIHDISLEGRH